MLTSLADLLREALRREREVTLQEELEFLQKYLDIEQTPTGIRLTAELTIEGVRDRQLTTLQWKDLVSGEAAALQKSLHERVAPRPAPPSCSRR